MKNNKGFSLVELIVVIAIMAVLVGIMAPQLIRYIENARVSSDESLLNDVYTAVVYAMSDPAVFQDPASEAEISRWSNQVVELSSIASGTKLYEEITSTLGWPDLSQATYQQYISSTHLSSSYIYFEVKGTAVNPVGMWISNTDATGRKDTSENPSSYADIEKCICIR